MKQPRRQERLDQVLNEIGATLVRERKHRVFRLPNGQTFVAAKSPKDHRSELNAISRVRRMARSLAAPGHEVRGESNEYR